MSTPLRLITYMSPDMPLEFYKTFQYFFEKVLNVDCYLTVETRRYGPEPGKDPLELDVADIAFMSSTTYMKLLDEKSSFELLPVVPVFDLSTERNQSFSYLEVVIHKSKKEDFKTFDDLRGHRWAVTDSECVSGYSKVLGELKKMGHNANFFGSFIHTANQRKAVECVLDRTADAAAVEFSVLKNFLNERSQNDKNELHVFATWGPYAPEPIVVSKKLSGDIKTKLVSALLNISSEFPQFMESFRKFGVTSFSEIDPVVFDATTEVLKAAEGEQLYPVYY